MRVNTEREIECDSIHEFALEALSVLAPRGPLPAAIASALLLLLLLLLLAVLLLL